MRESHIECMSGSHSLVCSRWRLDPTCILSCMCWVCSLVKTLSIDNANFILWAHAHQYWYSHNCIVCWLSTKENVHYDHVLPLVLLHGCGSQVIFGVLCVYMECFTYIRSTPYTHHRYHLYICSTAFVHRALHPYMDHGIYGTLHNINGAVHFYVEYSIYYIWSTTFIYGGFLFSFDINSTLYSTTFTLGSMTS